MMQLEHITFQRRGAKHKKPFSQLYKRWFNPVPDGRMSLMVELLRRLEAEVEAPPCWVCTSHASVIFYRRDVAVYGKEETGNFLFTVRFGYDEPGKSGTDVPTFVVCDCANKTHQLNTVDEAIQTIIFILREAGVVKAGENDLSAR